MAVDPERFDEVVQALRDAGLTVVSEQPLIGSIAGTVAEERVPTIEAVPGVEAVDIERGIRIPPPDSPLQ